MYIYISAPGCRLDRNVELLAHSSDLVLNTGGGLFVGIYTILHCQYCIVYYSLRKGVGRGGLCNAQHSCNIIALLWAMQVGEGNAWMINFCIKA